MFSSFTASGDVQRHKVVHTGEKPHLCDICGRGMWHLSISNNLHYPFDNTPICELVTSYYWSLIVVWATTIETCVPCHVYCSGFNNLSNLKEHKRTHATDKTFTCDQCGKSFNTHRKLLKHKARHAGEKPHSCATCGKQQFLPVSYTQIAQY